MLKNNKKYWLIPLSVICFIVVTILVSYFLLFTEFILFEGYLGGGVLDFCLSLFNSFVYIALSIICFYLIVPKLVLSNQMSIKPVLAVVFAMFIALAAAQCSLININSNSGFHRFLYNALQNLFYNAFDNFFSHISQGLYYLNKFLAYASILIINLIAPLSCVIGIKKKKSKHAE